MALFSKDLGIDFGTLYIRVVEGGRLVLEEPTVAAILVEELKLVEWGKSAQDMYGRVPDMIEVMRPMRNGVIADYDVAANILERLLRKVGGPRFFHPLVTMGVPHGITGVEQRAMHEAALQAGSRDVVLVWHPQAAALGIDLPIGTPSGNMVLCLGGGCTQAAVIAMFGIVAAEMLRMGGLQLDDAIMAYVRKKYGLVIGQVTAEQIKIKIGAAVPQDEEKSIEVQGQDQVTGLPRPVSLTTGETIEAMQEVLAQMVGVAKRVLEKTPPELMSDIIDRGVALTGGGALLRGIDRLMTKELGVPAYVVDNPTTCIAEGALQVLKSREMLRRYLPQV
jgi:rod shape-determining protein MreB